MWILMSFSPPFTPLAVSPSPRPFPSLSIHFVQQPSYEEKTIRLRVTRYDSLGSFHPCPPASLLSLLNTRRRHHERSEWEVKVEERDRNRPYVKRDGMCGVGKRLGSSRLTHLFVRLTRTPHSHFFHLFTPCHSTSYPLPTATEPRGSNQPVTRISFTNIRSGKRM